MTSKRPVRNLTNYLFLSADTALRFERYLGISASLLIRLQSEYGISKALAAKGPQIQREILPAPKLAVT